MVYALSKFGVDFFVARLQNKAHMLMTLSSTEAPREFWEGRRPPNKMSAGVNNVKGGGGGGGGSVRQLRPHSRLLRLYSRCSAVPPYRSIEPLRRRDC